MTQSTSTSAAKAQVSDPELDRVFQALSHPGRRLILDVLAEQPGANVSEVCGFFDTSRIAVMKHLRVLEAAGLVISKKEGRERKLYFNVIPIQTIYDRWTTHYSSLWASRLTGLKYRIEAGEIYGPPSDSEEKP
ncbi:MAG: helix-turn-helix transcriptional regulator [Acidobacteriota bacterium]